MTAAISAQGVGKRYSDGDEWALRGVSFALPRGQALGIVGENGSGKSTLLDLLLETTRPSEGTLEMERPSAALLELGAGLFAELTGFQNAVQMGLLAGLDHRRAREAAEAAGAFAELGDFLHRPVRTYSAGMAMRLGFAVASSLRAPVTLVDEVLAVGDGYFQRKCIDRLLELKRGGSTLVVASHDLHAVRALCDQALWLREGRMEALGPPEEVVGRYEEHLRRRSPSADLPAGRQGTGEIAICDVRLLDEQGRERSEFHQGETLRVEVLFETRGALESPVMGVALFREDGVYCYGPNTKFDGCLSGTYEGRYRLTAEFPELPLLGGRYQASVAFYDRDHVYAYAWHHRLYPFRVAADRPDHGLVHLRHRFSIGKVGE